MSIKLFKIYWFMMGDNVFSQRLSVYIVLRYCRKLCAFFLLEKNFMHDVLSTLAILDFHFLYGFETLVTIQPKFNLFTKPGEIFT